MARSREATSPSGFDGTANRVGALALAITDRTAEVLANAGSGSESGAAALSTLHHFLHLPSIDRVRQVLGLTHSGTVRLIDRLERDGLVRRRPGIDGRSTSVSLTAAGRRAALRLSTARADVLASALSVLSPAERTTLNRLVGKVLVGMMREPGATRWTCRLCDTVACGRYVGECPIAVAAQARYGSSQEN
jgi:DNA-binding MarR family transcriptional regulator